MQACLKVSRAGNLRCELFSSLEKFKVERHTKNHLGWGKERKIIIHKLKSKSEDTEAYRQKPRYARAHLL